MSLQRVVVSGGGTGGHIYPALALCDQLKIHSPEVEILYIGSQRGLEKDIVPNHGLNFKSLPIQGFVRDLSLENIRTVWQMLSSTWQARQWLKEFDPDIVIGTGGYVCGPTLLAASWLKIPTIIHEQNSTAGITNKFLARFVDRIAIVFDAVRKDFEKYADKIVMTGNPRGQEIIQTQKNPHLLQEQFDLEDDLPTFLVFGGSQGAPAINEAVLESLSYWQHRPYQGIVVTGKGRYHEFLTQLRNQCVQVPSNLRIVPYLDNMPTVFRSIDLVIGRSGATTLTELTALGVPSILIPSPYVTANHQETNAQALVDQKAALMIRQDRLTGQILTQKMDELLMDSEELQAMRQAAQKLGITDASDRLIELMEDLTN